MIKVEPPEGDSFRVPGFHFNRGQRSLAINLRATAGHDAFLRLVAASDVVIDNYRPGVLEHLGIDYDSLAAVKPGIITVSVTGFGAVGPMAGRPGFDPILQAMSGMMAAQGGDSDPVFFTLAVDDVTAACFSVLGTCAALYHRMTGGGGQCVTTSLAAVAAFMQCGELIEYAGRPAAPVGGRDYQGPSPLRRYYRTADGWIRLSLNSAEQAGALLDWAGRPRRTCRPRLPPPFRVLPAPRCSNGSTAGSRRLRGPFRTWPTTRPCSRRGTSSLSSGRTARPSSSPAGTPSSAVRRPPAGSSRPASGNTRARSSRRSAAIPTSW